MSIRKMALTGLTALAALGGVLVLCGTPAYAAKIRFALPFSPFGDLFSGHGDAIDQTTGNLYVVAADTAIKVFAPTGGSPIADLTGTDTPRHEFGLGGAYPAVDNACYEQVPRLTGEACGKFDPSTGDIYVPDVRGKVVDKFKLNSKGEYEYICQFTGYTAAGGIECLANASGRQAVQATEFSEPDSVAVDREGNIYIADGETGGIYEFAATGEAVTAVAGLLAPSPDTIAVDSRGDIYVTSGYPGDLVELKRGSLTGPIESETLLSSNAYAVALDHATGRLFTVALSDQTVTEYGPEGKAELSFPSNEPRDVAINETSDDLYVSGSGAIEAFGPPTTLLSVTTEGAVDVQAESATINGSIDPEGESTNVQFQYGSTPSLGSNVSAAPAMVSGATSVPVKAELADLEPNLTYSYQLLGTDSESSFPGGVRSFKTPAVKPRVSVRPALFVTPGEAVLVGAVNPENSDTHYRFVFGTSVAYGTSLPSEEADLGSSFGERPVTSPVEELQPGTTYHYAVIASDSQGTVQSADMTFTTPAPPLPVVETGAAGEVAQNSATITGSVDPEGLSTGYEFDLGTDTGYGARVFGEVGSGSEPQAVSLNVGGLQPGTTYHYRLVASNTYGTAYGADETFTTPGFPTSVIAPPLTAPLVPVPVFSPPSTAGATLKASHPAKKAKPKEKRAKPKRRARKSSRDAGARGERRGGR
jgi:hypothetical protein